jgi:hypothetical protein
MEEILNDSGKKFLLAECRRQDTDAGNYLGALKKLGDPM